MTLKKQAARLLRKNWKNDPHGLAHELACMLRSQDVTNQVESSAPVLQEYQVPAAGASVAVNSTVTLATLTLQLPQASVLKCRLCLTAYEGDTLLTTFRSWVEVNGVSFQATGLQASLPQGEYTSYFHEILAQPRAGACTVVWKASYDSAGVSACTIQGTRSKLILEAVPNTNAQVVAALG